MVQNRKKHGQKSHPIIHCPTSKGSEWSEWASEQVSKQANGQVSGLEILSGFLVDLAHSELGAEKALKPTAFKTPRHMQLDLENYQFDNSWFFWSNLIREEEIIVSSVRENIYIEST